jgi:hypothetical protein
MGPHNLRLTPTFAPNQGCAPSEALRGHVGLQRLCVQRLDATLAVASSVILDGINSALSTIAERERAMNSTPSSHPPFPHNKMIDLLNCRIQYVDRGSGPPTLLLHGNPDSSAM